MLGHRNSHLISSYFSLCMRGRVFGIPHLFPLFSLSMPICHFVSLITYPPLDYIYISHNTYTHNINLTVTEIHKTIYIYKSET